MDVGLGPMLFVLIVSMTAVRSQIEKGPSNALKKVGDSVTLECVTVKKNCEQVEWQKAEGMQSPKLVYRNGQGMLNNDLYPPQRYSVNSTGGCSLTIIQLEISDSGRFICMQAVDIEQTRSSILVVISVRESCLSNVTSNALAKDDGYSLWCAINIPPKSVEPSNVTLSFHYKAVGETETTNEKQPLTVKTTLTGTARRENTMPRGCRASFTPNRQTNYDNTTAFLDVCTTQQLIVSYPGTVSTSGPYARGDTVLYTTDGHPPPTSKWTHSTSADVDGDTLESKGDTGDKYTNTSTKMVSGVLAPESTSIEVFSPPPSNPVKNIAVSTPCPYYKGAMVRCTADGQPPPIFKWTHSKSGDVVEGDTLEIKGDAGDQYTCTATNTVNESVASKSLTIEVSFVRPPPSSAVRSQIKKGPKNALNKVGDRVTLKCVTVNKNCDQVEWQKVEGQNPPKRVYRYGSGMLNNDVYPPQRYSVNERGGCSLTITQLEINDSGRFMCVQALDSWEEIRQISILVVISVTESCESNVPNNALAKDDGYSLWCAINIPAESLEPSNVALFFQNKAFGKTQPVGERETVYEKQPLGITVTTTLTGIATKENIIFVCRASFSPNTEIYEIYDSTTVTLDICTKQWIVSYPVENVFISVSPPGPDKSIMVRCTANGYPPPIFKWTHSKSRAVVVGDTLEIMVDAEDNHTCTATNTVKGSEASQKRTIEVSAKPNYGAMKIGPLESSDNERQDAEVADCGPGCIAGVVCGCLIIGVVIGAVAYAGLKDERSRVYVLIHFRKKKKNGQNGETEDVPSNGSKSSGSPKQNE